MKKKRKPRWKVSYAMQESARRMVEDVRRQIVEHHQRSLFQSQVLASGVELGIQVIKNESVSIVSCTYNSTVDSLSSNNYLKKDSWDVVRTWIMDDDNVSQIAEALENINKNTHYWD